MSRKRRPRHTPRGSRTPRVPRVPHQRPAPPAAPSLPWLVRPRSPKFRTFWWTVEIALWTVAVLCILWNLWMMLAVRSGVQHMEQPFAGQRLWTERSEILRQIGDDLSKFQALTGRRYPLMTETGSVVEGM